MYLPPARRVGANGQPRPKQNFTYSAPFTGNFAITAAGTAGATQTIGIPINQNSDFLAFGLQAIVTLADNVTFIARAPLTVLLTTSGGANLLMDQAQHLENMRGDGQLPGSFYWPMLLDASSVVQVTLTNLDPGSAYTAWIGLPGAKVFHS